ncbi:MAG: DUF2341 domain-containing protein [Thermosphaera aggregans]|jgi:hypothetical protein|uniref:DUF2341 domain-containing protein n=1 Tax=Thermosphaera aggregans TaxID=54254 RepID=UPI003C01B9D8
MPTPPLLHAIGTGFIIALLVGLFMYGLLMSEITMINNYTALLQYIADKIAISIRALYSSTYLANSNQSSISLNIPVEISSEKGYNVYIGRGEVLALEFPRLREREDYNSQAFYVIASTPDKKVYGISLLFQPTHLVAPLELAKGELTIERIMEGFDPAEGYMENGMLWLCRSPVYIIEKANTSLSNYLVKIEFNPSILNCTYQGEAYTPARNDVRFADSDGISTLKYWIDEWRANYARVWVQIPVMQPLENKTIYMYWGNPYATERSDPAIFLFYDDLTRYSSLRDLLARSPLWGIRPFGTSSYDLLPGGWLTGVLDIGNNGFLILYYNRFLTVDQYQGVLVEALGRPHETSSDGANYLLGLVNVGDGTRVFNETLRPVIVDPSLSLENYTIIYGSWSIGNLNEDTFLNATSFDYVADKGYYALAVRSNPPLTDYSEGHEQFEILYKIRIDNTSTVRGVVITEGLNMARALYIALQYAPGDNRLKLLYSRAALPGLGDFQVLNSTQLVNMSLPSWVILYISVRFPGQANPEHSFQVINPVDGSIILSSSGRGTLAVYQPEYVGPFAYSPGEPPGHGEPWFDDLLSCRYDANIPLDIRRLIVADLSPGWEITIVDYKDVLVYDEETNTTRIEKRVVYARNATVDDLGNAYFDLTTYPILGEQYPVEFLFYYNGDLVDRIEYPGLVSGGMVLFFRPYLQYPVNIDGGLIFTYERVGGESHYHIKVPGVVNTNLRAGYNITSIAYFNSKLYYFILNPEYYNSTRSTYNPYNFTYKLAGNFTFFIGLMVYGSNGPDTVNPTGIYEGPDTVNLTGIYRWVRVRPFVDPEPVAQPSYLTEALNIPNPPQLRVVEYVDKIVFSSELLVDLFLIVRPDSHYVLTIVFRGRRA